MKISKTGLNLIKKYEGCRLVSYQDSVGVWTIGYGHTKGVGRRQKITQRQADEFLEKDCVAAQKNVMKYYAKYSWNQNQFDALVSFAFNIGSIDQLTAKGTRTIAQISAKIPSYCKAGGKVLAGLAKRRNEEKRLFDTPVKTGKTSAKKSIDEIAQEVKAGKWGNGEERRKRLEAAGYDYDQVQAKVNALLKR